jgi:hypothetical protein
MEKLVLRNWLILLRLAIYFADCGHSHNGWGGRWHIAAVTARYAKGLCLMYDSWQI